ncbi:hypothetical protein CW735_05005 [Alteromonas sp. MB-3u-76]|uniref:cytidylyltransferase domain-containing protein n=1 Tax=Alteromonas sp. MB-3u-76 TaxID=2058133 RepID=UPI000C309329|nr:NTP transferase domain-containing protein [Alteromonas sp. MB-3u-76]AUC87637.1 hypothetical protein CW735_05005 [Alteromonas sp. MB-3u-76]
MLDAELLIVIGARLNSSRLPKKHLLNLAGKTLIQRLVDRLSHIKVPHNIVIATTNDDYNQALVELANQINVNCLAYPGSVDDLVGRIDTVVKSTNSKYVAYICGDCPLVEPTLIEKLFLSLKADSSANFSALKDSRKSIHEGIAVYSHKGWQHLVDMCNEAADREHVGLSLKKSPDLSTQTAYVEEDEIYFTCDHRISVDTQADYQFMSAVYERWYAENDDSSIVPLSWVIKTLTSDVSLKSINQLVVQKSADKEYQKIVIITETGTDKGLGQLSRCLNLSQYLQENHGLGTKLLILADGVPVNRLALVNHKVFNTEASLLNYLATQKNKTLLFDLFPSRLIIQKKWQEHLKKLSETNKYILGIDRCAEWQSLFDHIWIPSFYCNRISIDNISYGWNHYMVKPVERKPIANRLLILTGGSDALGYGSWLPKWLDTHLPSEVQPTWVQGPYSSPPKLPEHENLSWKVSTQSDCLHQHLSEATWVMTVYGVTLFEALASNIPSIVLPSIPIITQEEYDAFQQQNVAVCLDDNFNEETANTLSAAFVNLIETNDKREELALKVRSGLENICSSIADFIN